MGRFRMDPTFMGWLGQNPEMHETMEEIATQGEQLAKADAPVDEGTFQSSLEGRVVVEDGVAKAVISSDDPKWVYLEFGTSDTPTFATLRTTLDRLDL